jgi:subfamily B ATP-binding cassette protein MsbA
LALPFTAKFVIDEVIVHGRGELLLPITLGAGLAVMVQALSTYGAAQATAVIGQRAMVRLQRRLHRHALHLPVRYFDRTPTGSLISRFTVDAEHVGALFGTGSLQLVSAAFTATIAFAVLLWLDWRLTAFVGVALVLVAIGLSRGFAGVHRAFSGLSELHASLAGRLTEVFGGIRVVKVCAAERREALAYVRDNHRVLRASIDAHHRVARLAATIVIAGGWVSLGVLILGSQVVAHGALSMGDLTLFVLLVGLLTTPVIQVAAVGADLGRGLAALGRIRTVLAVPTEKAPPNWKLPKPSISGSVVCDDVTYAYIPGHPVLRHVSLFAPEGATIAILGANGAGKSTLLSLLAGFDDPTSGQILIDGHPLPTLDRLAYRRRLGIVLQRDQLIDGTIADNIRYARPAASIAEFRRAARLAQCEEFIGKMPAGYDTLVGERGVRLSGGQRQRVAIARTLLADPRILLLDELTAHLDHESERLARDAIASLCRGRTAFVIAHRLTTLPFVDQILVLHNGSVVERGTHEDLLSRRGRYWQLVGAPDAMRPGPQLEGDGA